MISDQWIGCGRLQGGHNLIINLSLYSIPDVTTRDSHHSSVTLTLVEQQCTAVSGAYYIIAITRCGHWPGQEQRGERSASVTT